MSSSTQNSAVPSLRTAIVLAVTEEACTTWSDEGENNVDFAPFFPSERTKRVSPGHLVAIANLPNSSAGVIVWRWFDAVVLDEMKHQRVHIWEPTHGEVVAELRPGIRPVAPGSRVWASAGLPGAEWWIANTVDGPVEEDGVELNELRLFLVENDLWPL